MRTPVTNLLANYKIKKMYFINLLKFNKTNKFRLMKKLILQFYTFTPTGSVEG